RAEARNDRHARGRDAAGSAQDAPPHTRDVPGNGLEPGDRGDEPALVLDLRVPVLEALVELAELVAAPLEPHGLARVGADAVLVPRELPGDGHGQLAGGAGERDDARARLAEALRDAADGAAIGAAVEEVGGLEQRDLGLGELAEDRLLPWERALVGGARETEELAEVALAAPAAAALQRRCRRRAFPDPACLDGELLAERADVHELGAFGRRKAHGALAHQQRPLAHRAGARRCDLRNPHPASDVTQLAQDPPSPVMSLSCVFYM